MWDRVNTVRMRKRHDLVEITDKGRLWASEHQAPLPCHHGVLPQALKLITEGHDGIKIPGIVRREECENIQGAIPVGFSSPYLVHGHRLRVGAFVPQEEVLSIHSPYQRLEMDFSPRTACLKALVQIKRIALNRGITLGVWGSAGLEIYTGLPYTNRASDLDLLIGIAELNSVLTFAEEALCTGLRYDCRVDIEMDLPSGYGINVAELLTGAGPVLGKSLNRVDLISRSSIWEMCRGTN
jgi:phosphoribosyl-dephospho-CoA transferase